jgi:hypothetical protein
MEWIFTKNELPKPTEHNKRISETVLIYDGYDMMVGCYHFGRQEWCSLDQFFRANYPIIAWMPIPKPPEEK